MAPFERYMRADDRPGYAMAFKLRLRFSGRLDLERWQEALRFAQNSHPLLRAVVQGRGDRLNWVAADPAALPFTVGAGTAGPGGAMAAFDLAAERGWRVRVDQAENAVVTAEFHHANCDALGALNFLDDALRHYAGRGAAQPPSEAAAELRRRTRLNVTWRQHLRRLRWDVAGTANFLRARPQPLAVPAAAPACLPGLGEAVAFRRLAPAGGAAARGGATVNDVLLAHYFATLVAWNRKHGVAGEAGLLRVAVPTNLRALGGPRRTACNVVSMVFLDRRADQPMAEPAFTAALHQEMAGIRRRNMGVCFLRILGTAAAVPGGIALLLDDSCRSTSVLSNLGVVWADSPLAGPDGRLRVGDAVLERIEFLPPIRPLSRVGVGALSYAGQLTLALNCDVRTLSARDGHAVLADFAARLLASPLQLIPA